MNNEATSRPDASQKAGGRAPIGIPASVVLDPERRLNAREVAAMLGVGLTTLSTLVAQGKFVNPDRVGLASNQENRPRRWRRGDVVDWLNAERLAVRGPNEQK